MQIDRRVSSRDRRQAVRAPLTAAVVQRSGDSVQLAQASNIGELGMTVRYVGDGAPAHLPRTPVALTFQLPGADKVIEARAEVVFDRSDGAYRTAGFRFSRIAPSAIREIARYINS
jgi:c-di-GMP-binding flagellar brake protein YcgR